MSCNLTFNNTCHLLFCLFLVYYAFIWLCNNLSSFQRQKPSMPKSVRNPMTGRLRQQLPRHTPRGRRDKYLYVAKQDFVYALQLQMTDYCYFVASQLLIASYGEMFSISKNCSVYAMRLKQGSRNHPNHESMGKYRQLPILCPLLLLP